MSSSALPPPGNLPSWSRVSTLDRSRYPKPFLRDRIPLPPGGTTITTDSAAMMDFNASLGNVGVKFLDKMPTGNQQHAFRYDKSIQFLQDQHANTLKKLHEELDFLKRENKELQFKMLLAHRGNTPLPPSSKQTQESDIKTLLLQEEVKDLQQALQESTLKNKEMQHAIFMLQSQGKNTGERHSSGDGERTKTHRRKYSVSSLSTPLPLNATLNPLQIREGVNETSRVPSMSECETIIQRLHEVNCQQLAELSRLRNDMRISSRNSTPEPYISKTVGLADNESFSDTRLPRIPVKPIGKKSIKSASSALEVKISLPALTNTISSNIADRQKRQNALQKQKNNKTYK
uniref:uncharacterized protein LOC120338692 n=1 Tax=Styela clava TaxID=7725 RepID=UPI001939C1BF|nr:uncharacterized protein LOC120338692 [Styela clava]